MAYAIIDLGSNSVRLSVYECKGDEITKIFSNKEVAGLAGYVSKGIMNIAGIMKACAVLNNLRKVASRFAEPQDIHLFAAASLRNIDNRAEAVDIITRETSLTPYVLDGEEEAALGFAGAAKYSDCENGLAIDIGGASTELVLIKNYNAVKLTSLPVGCLNLSVNYIKRVIPVEAEEKRIKTVIREQLSAAGWDAMGKHPYMIGSGGTMRATLKLARDLFSLPAESQEFDASHVKEITELLKKKDENNYLKVYQIIPERLMTISAGLAILRQVIAKFGCETISVSKFGVREGYLVDRVLMTNGKYFIQ